MTLFLVTDKLNKKTSMKMGVVEINPMKLFIYFFTDLI